MAAPLNPEQELLRHLPLIERAALRAARRMGLRTEESEEFVAELKLKLVSDDYAVIRKYKGESLITTYLIAVINHFALDYRNHLWGKWRTSAEAKKLGATAVIFERLTVRDGHSLDEAFEIMRTNHSLAVTQAELEDIAARIGVRVRPKAVGGLEDDAQVVDPRPRPDQDVLAEEQERERSRVAAAVREAIATLPPEDQLIVRMRIDDGFRVADIARMLNLPEKLYPRIDGIYKRLRAELQRRGIDASVVARLYEEEDGGRTLGETVRKGRIRSVQGSGKSVKE